MLCWSAVVTVGLALACSAVAAPPAPRIVTGLDAGWPDVRGWDLPLIFTGQRWTAVRRTP